jgi:UDP:flavonoid glycosyltransferase YjiC (YdhE family)
VQPCVALGLGLERAGHQVTVATWAPFRQLVEGNGLSFYPIAGPDPGRLMAALVETGSNPLEFARRFRGFLRPHIRRGFYDCLAACRNADAIVYTPLGFAGYMVAELLRLPAVGSVVEPLFVRTGRYPGAMLGRPPGGSMLVGMPGLGRLYNYLTHLVVEQIYWRTAQPLVADMLRAGVPSVVIPVLPDQAFWAWRMAALGAGPDPIPPRRLTTERLASAVQRATTDVEMRRRCKELGEKISAEDGVGQAVEAFEEHIRKRHR